MLAFKAENELRRDGDHSSDGRNPRLIGPQQQAQRQSGNQRRAQIDMRQAKPAGATDLRCKGAQDRQRAIKWLRAEIDKNEIDQQQRYERHDLKVACIRPPAQHGSFPQSPTPVSCWGTATLQWPPDGRIRATPLRAGHDRGGRSRGGWPRMSRAGPTTNLIRRGDFGYRPFKIPSILVRTASGS